MLSIGKAAQLLGVHAQTIRRWEAEGKIKAHRTVHNQRRYKADEIKQLSKEITGDKIIYCRVSSRKQDADLQRQIQFMLERYPNYVVISDISSGVHYDRPGIRKILERILLGTVQEIAVAHKDRIGRFGTDLFITVAELNHVKITIVDNEDTSPENEIAEDIISIITSFAARVHGSRKYLLDKGKDTEAEGEDSDEEDIEELDEGEHKNI